MHRGAGPHAEHDGHVRVEVVLVGGLLDELSVLGILTWADGIVRSQRIVEDEGDEYMPFLLQTGAPR
jgi:hypothetical protein